MHYLCCSMQFNLFKEQFKTRHKVAESTKLQCSTWVALCRISELQSPTRYNVLRYLRNVVYYLCCSMQNLNEHQRFWCISYAESLKDIWKPHLEHNFSSSQKFGSSTLESQAAAQYLQDKRSSSDKKSKLLNLRKCRNPQKQYYDLDTSFK